MFSRKEIQAKLVAFMHGRFDMNVEEVDQNTNLFEEGYIDSLDSLVVIRFIEKTFDLTITPDELIEHPIYSVNQMVEFIANKKG